MAGGKNYRSDSVKTTAVDGESVKNDWEDINKEIANEVGVVTDDSINIGSKRKNNCHEYSVNINDAVIEVCGVASRMEDRSTSVIKFDTACSRCMSGVKNRIT